MNIFDSLPPEKQAIAQKVVAAARKYGVPESIALAMAMQESTFDQSQRSKHGPVGVMQMSGAAAKDMGVNRFDTNQNIDGGVRYMKRQLDKHKDPYTALVAYHDGPGSAYFKGGSMSPEAAHHIKKVKEYASMAQNSSMVKNPNDEYQSDDTAPYAPSEGWTPTEPVSRDTTPATAGTKSRARDLEDVGIGLAGAAAGYKYGSDRPRSLKEQQIEISKQRLALAQQQAAKEALAAKKPVGYGQGAEDWKNTQFNEEVARQVQNPSSQKKAQALGMQAEARIDASKNVFPTQIPAAPGSSIYVPVNAGSGPRGAPPKTPMPTSLAPASAAPMAPPASNMPAMNIPKGSKLGRAGNTLAGDVAASQAYDAYQRAQEGDYPGAVLGGLSSMGAAATLSKNPKAKILGGLGSLAATGLQQGYDYLRDAPEEFKKYMQEHMPHFAGGGLAPHGLRHSGEGAKGSGYFGAVPNTMGDDTGYELHPNISTELSAESEGLGEYPLMAPGLTAEELSHLVAGGEPTPEMYAKAEAHARMRKDQGKSPFAGPTELRMPIPHMAGGKLVKDAAKKVFQELGDRFPSLVPGAWKIDPKSGKEYLGKVMSSEEESLQAARKAAQKDIDKGNYKPYFDVSQRFHADPQQYPMAGETLTQAVPKKQATADKWAQMFDTPEAAARLRAAYGKAKDDPLTHNWYAMGQLEQKFVDELGPEMGRKMFRQRFAEPMAATTGGADPTANMLSAYYGNFMRAAGKPMGAGSTELPHPIGGRYITGNLAMYDKVLNQGAGLGVDTPKRFNFASNFMGHQGRPTLDEQMSGIFDPTLKAPPGDSYGIMENVLNKAAAAEGVTPVNFQEVAWAGQKGTKGKPMIQHVNEAIERTARVTGKTPEEVLRDSLIHARSPLYGGAAAGLGGLSQYQDQK